MARILRGEVYWADLDPVRGSEQAGSVIALAISGQPQRAGFPLTHRLQTVRLPKPSWVKISQVRTLSTERLGRRLGAVSSEELDQIVEGLFDLVG